MIPYPTLDAAAIAAEQACEQVSFASGFEYGGALLRGPDGMYYFTAAQTSGSPMHLDFHVRFSASYTLVGLYHTHPGQLADGRWFSDLDTRTADKLHVESYIGIEYEAGIVRKYVPGVTHIDHPQGSTDRLAYGLVVR